MRNNSLPKFLLILILIIGAFFRFYKLNWGNGLYTHPDEYHIIISVNQLSFPNQMNPHFFSYGTVTIYLIYFTKLFLTSFSWPIDPFLIGRFYSALFSTLTIFVTYQITKILTDKKTAFLAAFLTALTPGLIQQAHFTTPESNLIFFVMTSLLFSLKYLKIPKLNNLIFSSIFLGLALGTKVSTLLFGPTLLFAIILSRKSQNSVKIITHLLTSGLVIFLTFLVVDPYVFWGFSDFRNSLNYEGSLAAGSFVVFYTRQFIGTIPIIFQFEKIYPVTEGIILPISLVGFIISVFLIFKRKSEVYFLLVVGFLLIFIPNSFLFAKWTRFISPTFPFLAIFAAITIKFLLDSRPKVGQILKLSAIFGASIWTLAVFSIYLNPDIRITASKWLEINLPAGSSVLVEEGNTVEVPLKGNFRKLGYDFYELEDNPFNRIRLAQALSRSDYFIVESRRVFANLGSGNSYPITSNFYHQLFNGKMGFVALAQFSSYPSLEYLGVPLEFPDENTEETWSVFDHPVIRVYKKAQNLSVTDYLNLLQKQL